MSDLNLFPQQTLKPHRHHYIVDDNQALSQILAEMNASGQLLATYLHGEDLISQSRSGKTHFYHYDGLGSTRVLSDHNGECNR